ncbi:unnamed protein product [Lactuca virosa]|uniref:Uncharacterized protein n=1 Tax=Lactuca virosa TaxID=75947 RepID=A0AAU9P1H0_9ASTR|nr:unnamed protein product [Lactuca virosa]
MATPTPITICCRVIPLTLQQHQIQHRRSLQPPLADCCTFTAVNSEPPDDLESSIVLASMASRHSVPGDLAAAISNEEHKAIAACHKIIETPIIRCTRRIPTRNKTKKSRPKTSDL